MFSPIVQLCAVAGLASATNLFVSSYDGNITTLSLTETNGSYNLGKTYSNDGCAPNPSWLTLDYGHGVLYCLDEGLTTVNGTLSSFTIGANGELDLVEKKDTINGPVSGIVYGNPATGKRAIALAHYVGSAVSSWTLSPSSNGNFTFNEAFTYELDQPGPNAQRQDAPHEHEAVVDPTGQFILVPDLGADVVRVFSIDPDTLKLTPESPLEVTPGSGPRHIAFYNPHSTVCKTCTSYMFLVTELTNRVISYRLSYPAAGGMSFTEAFNISTFGDNAVPVNNTAAEIEVSPDNRFLIVSNRNNTIFNLPNPDYPTNKTEIPSDAISTYQINKADGSLTHTQLWPAGGFFPRSFSISKAGDLVAVGLQYSSEVVILSRDVASGNLGRPVAAIAIDGQVTSVVWNE